MNWHAAGLLFASLAASALGLFVYLNGCKKKPNVVLFHFCLALALWTFGQFLGGINTNVAAILWCTRASILGAIFVPVLFLHFILVLIDDEAVKRNLLTGTYYLTLTFALVDLTGLLVARVAPAAGFAYYPVAGPLFWPFSLFAFVCFGYAFLKLLLAARGATGDKRNQLWLVWLASIFGFAGGATVFFPLLGINFPVLVALAIPLYIAALVYAIVRHKLLEISIIVRQGLVYSALTVLFAGLYVLAVLVSNYLITSYLVVIFLAVLVFQPLKDRVQSAVDKIFFQGEFRYQKTIADLSADNLSLYQSLLRADKLAALGTISAGLAHEIKNPLAAIKGMTQVLDENLNDPQFIKDYQELVTRQIDRLDGLVEKLLSAGKPQGLTIQQFDLNRVIREALALLETQTAKKGIKVVAKFGPQTELEGDPGQLNQVFINLFLNAIQSLSGGGELLVQSRKQGEMITAEVTDNGPGIAAENLNKIFDPFFSTRTEGSGLGLAMVYRIIKEHNGEIRVRSIPGKETVFTIWLPIRRGRSV